MKNYHDGEEWTKEEFIYVLKKEYEYSSQCLKELKKMKHNDDCLNPTAYMEIRAVNRPYPFNNGCHRQICSHVEILRDVEIDNFRYKICENYRKMLVEKSLYNYIEDRIKILEIK